MKKRTPTRICALMLSLSLLLCFPLIANAEEEECNHYVDPDDAAVVSVDGTYHAITGICEYCEQEVTINEPHEWDDWYVAKKATVFKKGQKERVCWYCEATQTKSISKVKPFAKFKKKTYSVVAGKSLKMKSKIKMGNGDTVKKWNVSNKSVATITTGGKIKAKKKGTIKVTAILKSGKKATCTVKVKAPKKTSAKKSSGGGTVYWVSSGDVYHVSRNCRTLKRSKTVYSGTIKESGKSRRCKVCG